jgi:hypothetical protein
LRVVVAEGEIGAAAVLALVAVERVLDVGKVGRGIGVVAGAGVVGRRVVRRRVVGRRRRILGRRRRHGLVALVGVGRRGAAGVGHVGGAVAVVVGAVRASGEGSADDRQVATVGQVDRDIGLADAEVDVGGIDRAREQHRAEDAECDRDQKPVFHAVAKFMP